jgi:hypothetical protein
MRQARMKEREQAVGCILGDVLDAKKISEEHQREVSFYIFLAADLFHGEAFATSEHSTFQSSERGGHMWEIHIELFTGR